MSDAYLPVWYGIIICCSCRIYIDSTIYDLWLVITYFAGLNQYMRYKSIYLTQVMFLCFITWNEQQSLQKDIAKAFMTRWIFVV